MPQPPTLQPRLLFPGPEISPPASTVHEARAAELPVQPLPFGEADSQSLQCKPDLPNMNGILEAIMWELGKSYLQTECEWKQYTHDGVGENN